MNQKSIVSLAGDPEILPPEPVPSLPAAHAGSFAYFRTRKHRTPIEILKSFIKAKEGTQGKVIPPEAKELRKYFEFLKTAYKDLGETRLVTNQIHFYTMITAIID